MRLRHGVHEVEDHSRFHHVTEGSNGSRRDDEVFVRVKAEKDQGGARTRIAELGRDLKAGYMRQRGSELQAEGV